MRAKARQNLQVATVNTALERKLMSLEPEPEPSATFEFMLGELPVIAHVIPTSEGAEVLCQAIVCPTELGRRCAGSTIFHEWRRFGTAVTNFWLESLAGKHLQPQSYYTYRGSHEVSAILGRLAIEPNGFGTGRILPSGRNPRPHLARPQLDCP